MSFLRFSSLAGCFSGAALFVLLGREAMGVEFPVLQTGHHTPVHQVGYSPDGRWVATQGLSGEVRIWNRKSLSLMGTFSAVSGLARGVEFSADGRYLTARVLGAGYLCDRVGGRILHQQSEARYLFGPKNNECWFVAGGRIQRRSLPGFEVLAEWAPENGGPLHQAGFTGGSRLIAHHAETGFTELDPENLKPIRKFPQIEVKRPYYSLIPLPNRAGFLVDRYKQVEMLDLENENPAVRPVQVALRIGTPSISPDGKTFVVGIVGGVEWFSIDEARSIRQVHLKAAVNNFAWSPDGSELAVVTDRQGVFFLDAQTGEKRSVIEQGAAFSVFLSDPPCGASPDGRVLALAGDDGWLRILRFGEKVEYRAVKNPDGASEMLHVFDGHHIVTGKESNYRLWNAEGVTGEPLRVLPRAMLRIRERDWFGVRGDREFVAYGMADGKWVERARLPSPAVGAFAVSGDLKVAIREGGQEPSKWEMFRSPDGRTDRVLSREKVSWLSPRMVNRAGLVYGVDTQVGLVKAGHDDEKWQVVDLKLGATSFGPSALSADARFLALRVHRPMPATVVIDLSEEKMVSILKNWTPNETPESLEVMNFLPDPQFLWACGPDGRPVLYQTLAGEPLLRVTTWADGGWVMESPQGDIDANEAGREKIRWLDAEDAVLDEGRTKANHKPEKIHAILTQALQ